MDYRQAQEYINEIPKFAKKNTLEHTKEYMRLLGNPCQNAKIIHVAGTNGKGSVCNYLRAMLLAHGFRTGMFVSPHLTEMRERIWLDEAWVLEEEFMEAFHRVFDLVEQVKKEKRGLNHPTFFEFLFLMAVVIFEKQSPDYIIMETGMGGRLDTTNVFEQPVLTIITEVGLDHCEYLGETKAAIAKEKAGIIKPGVPLVFVNKEKTVSEVLSAVAKRCDCRTYPVDKRKIENVNINHKSIDFSYKSSYYNNVICTLHTCGMYQVENAAVALCGFEVLFSKEEIDVSKLQSVLAETCWAGRMEEIREDVFVDGAHNEDGIGAFLESVEAVSGDRKCWLLFSVVSDKNYRDMIHRVEASGLFDGYIVAGIADRRGLSGEQMLDCFQMCDRQNIYLCESVQEAYSKALSLKGDGVLFVAGSLYLAGELKALLKEESK